MKKEKGATISLLHRIIIKDKDGKVKSDTGLQPSHSFLIQFLRILGSMMQDLYYAYQYQDITNQGRYIANKSNWDTSNRPFAIDGQPTEEWGIVPGTGTTPETNSDYKLETRIDHGSTPGKLMYGASSWAIPEEIGVNVDFVIQRSFQNLSGGAITIEEIGVYAAASGIAGQEACIARDVLAEAKTVDNGETAIIQYTFRTAVTQ